MVEDEKRFDESSDKQISDEPAKGIEKALAKEPEDRHQAAAEEFEAAPHEAGITSLKTAISSPAIRTWKKRLFSLIVTGLFLATAAGAGAWLWSEKKANKSVVAKLEIEETKMDTIRTRVAVPHAEANMLSSEPLGSEIETVETELENYGSYQNEEFPDMQDRKGIDESPLSKPTERKDKNNQNSSKFNSSEDAQNPEQANPAVQLLQPGRVRITSQPEGADLFIDGKLMGSTPFEGILDPGLHRLLLKKKGYTELEDEFTVRQFSTGEPFVYHAELFRDFE